MFALNLVKSLPFQLVSCLVLGLIFGPTLPIIAADTSYTISCIIKDVLMLALPYVIFCYLWAAIVSFGNKGLVLILSTFALIIIANLVALFTAYAAGSAVLPYIVGHTIPHFDANMPDAIKCLWSLSDIMAVDFLQPKHGMIAGITLGFTTVLLSSSQFSIFGSSIAAFAAKTSKQLSTISLQARNKATMALKAGFIPFLPLYVLGFVVKLARDGHLLNLIHGCAKTAIFIWLLIIVHLFFWYYVGSGFNTQKAITAIKNMLPAGLTGFTTMSSSATMPVTLACMEKNLKDSAFANFFAPATANPHMTGDGLSITIIAMALLLMSGHQLPPLSTFIIFAMHYCLVKFSAAGVPGGGVIVILPVARDYLGLDEALMPLLQTIYMLQDPILTSTNVMGNGAFSLVAHRLMKPFMKKSHDVKEVPCAT